MNLKYPAALALLCASTAQATSVFINEIHYDNTGGDVGEFVEIAAPQGTDLTGWSVEFYNGSNGTEYATELLSGVVSDDSGGYGFTTVYPSSIQNGAPDGVALINDSGAVVQFLSYEGSLTATDETASGLTSVDIGVDEPGTTPVGFSLQLSGTGTEYADFSWQEAAAETPGSINTGQSFGGVVIDSAPTVVITPADGESNVAVDANINLTFSEPVVISGYNTINCISEVSITVTATGEGTSYELDPDQDFVEGDSCSFTVNAADVTDLDDTPDNMAEDVTVAFDVIDTSVIVSLVINEFHADPAGDITGDANADGTRDFSDDEFVELVNSGSTDLDLSGWTLSDAVQLRHTFPSGSIVGAGCAVVVFGGGAPQGVFGGALVQTASAGSVGFNNGGDTITVTNGVSTFEVVYGSEGGNNQSLTLNPDVTGGAYSAHSDVEEANGALFSPGTKLDGTSFAGCTIPDLAPTVADITPADGATEVGVDSSINITFSEEVTVSAWPSLVCEASGNVALDGALSGTEFTLTLATELDNSDSCTFTLPAASVTDVDGTPDMMASDFVSSFNTAEVLSVSLISEVQGSGSASDLVGQTVMVEAIVTAVLPDSNVFYVQEEDADVDANSATSEGILVFNDDGVFSMPAVGDLVEVRGLVSEYFDRTQITLTSAPLIVAVDQVLPSAASLSLPVASLDDLEALEGMLVTSAGELIVTDVFYLGRYGQAALSSERLYNPTNIFAPGSAEAIALAESNSLDRVLLDDGNDNQNPEVVPFPTGGLSATNPLRMGDTVSALTGVVDYSFSDYRVIPTEEPTFVATNPRTSAPDLTLGNLKVASLNVLNFFNTIDTGASVCGPSADASCRGADDNGTDGNGLTEFERQKVKTIAAIVAMDADIVGLMEIENNGFAEGSAIADLVDGINAEMGEGTYSIVDPGNTIGTDAITVALIYKPASVTLSGQVQILTSDNSTADESGALFDDSRNRPSVIQKFALVENGEELVVSVNHLKSKGSSCGAGDDDETTGQGNCNLTRTRAAQALTAFITEQFGTTPTLIIGDLNAYAKEDPISAIIGEGYTDLANYFGGAEAYSYSFDGELGYLDHALASASMLDKVVDTTEWHINADEPIVLDYNLDFLSVTQYDTYFAPDVYRMSDHDPVVVSLLLEAEAVVGDVNGDGNVDMNDYFAFIASYGSSEGDAAYVVAADMNSNGLIDMTDFQLWYQVYLAQ